MKMQGGARLPAQLQLPRFDLLVTSAATATISQPQRALDGQDAKRTLAELAITENTAFAIRFHVNEFPTTGQWNNRMCSPDSSPETRCEYGNCI